MVHHIGLYKLKAHVTPEDTEDMMMNARMQLLTLFPMFILFALLGANRFWNAFITVWSLLYLALFHRMFRAGILGFLRS